VTAQFHNSDSVSGITVVERNPNSTDLDSTNANANSADADSTDTIQNGRIYPASGIQRNSIGSENSLASHLWSEADSANGLITPPPSPLYEMIDGRDGEHHTWDNGRRCHKYYRERSPYYLPNDEAEQERMNLVHDMFKLLLNDKLCAAPIDDPRHVLDVGTGTGTWAIEFADNYPNTRVTGIDLSPIQPRSVPPKVQFELDDCLGIWDFDSKFDFVFIREALSWVRDWRGFLEQAYNAMEPGAIIEFQNIHFPWRSESFCLDDSDPEQHSYYLIAGARELGIDLRADENLEEWLKQAGFINYKERCFPLCTSYTGENQTKQKLSSLNLRNLLDGLDAYSKGFMVHGLGWSPEQVELSLVEVRRRLSSKGNPVWMSASVCYAQKPAPEASTCHERQLSGVSEESTLGLSPSFESPELLEFLDYPCQGCHRKGRYGFTSRAHLSGHLRECYGGATSLLARRLQKFDRSGQQIIQLQGGSHSTS